MTRTIRSLLLLLWPGCLLVGQGLASAPAAIAEDVLVVLSSESAYYREALQGFQEELGQPAVSVRLLGDPGLSAIEARVVVAIGGKAALGRYAGQPALVYCMAPGTVPALAGPPGVIVRIETMPQASQMLREIRQIQPAMPRLGVLWASDSAGAYVEKLKEAAAPLGLGVLARRVDRAEGMPAALRELHGKVSALWVPLDPLLLDAESLDVLKNYSWANHVPLYVPSDGLVEHGAVASVSSSFREVGRLAARATRQVLAGQQPPPVLYPETLRTVVDLRAAARCGLEVSAAALEQADRVLR